jgi:agmatinase
MGAFLFGLIGFLLQHRPTELQEAYTEVNGFISSKKEYIIMKPKNKLTPLSALEYPRFSGITTFSRLPYLDEIKDEKVDFAILGVPFDGGTTYRSGARFGPRAIREASVMNRSYNPSLNTSLYENFFGVDAGDVQINPLNIQKTFQNIEKHYGQLAKKNRKIVVLGGDHSIAYPILRTLKKIHGPITLIHFDAHTDTADQAWGEKFHHGTPMRRLIEEKVLKGSQIFQIGIRGPLGSKNQETFDREHGIQTLPCDAIDNLKQKDLFFKKLKKTAGNGPCYITFDIDAIDPAFAPGTGTPVVGGLNSREALALVRELNGLNIVGADLVEVAPAYDHAEITSLLASALIFEFLCLMANSKLKNAN